MSFSPAFIGFGQQQSEQPAAPAQLASGGSPIPAGLIDNTSGGQFQPAQMQNTLGELAQQGTGGPDWNAFFAHPDVQNVLGLLNLNPSSLGVGGAPATETASAPTSPVAGATNPAIAPSQAAGAWNAFTGAGAQPNWLGTLGGQQTVAGPSATNPVAGSNYMGGNW